MSKFKDIMIDLQNTEEISRASMNTALSQAQKQLEDLLTALNENPDAMNHPILKAISGKVGDSDLTAEDFKKILEISMKELDSYVLFRTKEESND